MKAARRKKQPRVATKIARSVTRMTPQESHDLLTAARTAAAQAYCPYSCFTVGAALLAEDGRIFTGANVENASYGLTICAERAAVFTAVNAGVRRFRALAVAAGNSAPATPCGACRQVLAEFCDNLMPVFCSTKAGDRVEQTTLGELLPEAFRGDKGVDG